MRTKEQSRAYNQAYHKKHAEALRARSLEWYRMNKGQIDKEHRKVYMRAYRQANLEKWNRTPEQQKEINRRKRELYAKSEAYREECKRLAKRWQRNNPVKRKAQHIRAYGLTLEQMEAMMQAQGRKCAICGHSDTSDKNHFPVIDHCHATNKVRGILCGKCNKGIGLLMDNPKNLRAAADYLERV